VPRCVALYGASFSFFFPTDLVTSTSERSDGCNLPPNEPQLCQSPTPVPSRSLPFSLAASPQLPASSFWQLWSPSVQCPRPIPRYCFIIVHPPLFLIHPHLRARLPVTLILLLAMAAKSSQLQRLCCFLGLYPAFGASASYCCYFIRLRLTLPLLSSCAPSLPLTRCSTAQTIRQVRSTTATHRANRKRRRGGPPPAYVQISLTSSAYTGCQISGTSALSRIFSPRIH
jgi:hypothetical protein